MKKGKISTLVLVFVICVMMFVGIVPMATFAKSEKGKFSNSQLSLVQDKQSTLASGVTQNIYTVYDKNGKQVKMFAATIDMSVDTVKLFTSYQNMDNTAYGMSKLTEQVAAFDKKATAGDPYYHGTVVAGINASYYNMTTGKPSGVFVMNGNDVTGGEKSAYFAVLKDGTVKIGNAGEYESDKGNIQEALGIYKMLVYNNEIVLSDADKTNAQKYPRQTIGITEDNKVILLSADGNQEPESAGLTLMEQAQVMLDLGCKWAGHLDGGGSMTYGSKPEGEDLFKIVNKPSDGSERSVSNGLIVVSTAVASKTFDHVSYDVETEYATPGTPVAVSVSGVSTTGHAAEIPADITYNVVNGTYENGVLTATVVGDVVLTATYNGKEVGSVTIHAVVPKKLEFNSNVMTVPFGKTVTLALTATYGLNEVKIKANDIQFTLDNNGIGTIDGFEFTAGNGSVTASSITATFVGTTDVVAISNIKLGKGSEVIFDFEDGTTNDFNTGYAKYNYYLPKGGTFVATPQNGKVHSGNYSLGVNIDYTNSWESGYQMTALFRATTDGKAHPTYYPGAQSVGAWVYIPDEYVGLWMRWVVFPITEIAEDGTYTVVSSSITSNVLDGGAGGTGVVYSFSESGWHYLSCDLSKYKGLCWYDEYYTMQFYISDRDGASYGYYAKENPNINGNFTIYIDDITIDYSSVVDDREAPVFSGVNYATSGMSDAAALANGASIANNIIDFTAAVADNMAKVNATGIDASTAKAYVDGNEVACTYSNGSIALDSSVVLTAGKHTIKFSICDKQGNYASIIRTVNITSGDAGSVKVVPHDTTLDRILFGSLYYVDVVATDIANIQSVTTTLNLDSVNEWELEHMIVAKGFTVTYTYDAPDKILTLTITKTDETDATGEQALVSIPVRVWKLDNVGSKIGGSNDVVKEGQYTYTTFKNGNEYWWEAVVIRIQQGIVTFVNGETETFTGEKIHCDTEAWAIQKFMNETEEGKAYKAAWNGGHIHTAHAISDKAATCTEAGYTGRTYCKVCNSVVDWGTTVPATGHSYALVAGVLKCTGCDALFNGIWTDGKTYVDGVVIADGWNGDYYYVDGKKVTGIYAVDGVYYNFGDDGKNQGKYTGLVQIEGKWYYSKIGALTGGWVQIGENWHYFRAYTKTAVTGEYTVNGVTYQFDETGMTNGAWHTDDKGTRYYYGPSYYVARNPGYMTLHEIDGKTYNFGNDGYLTYGVQVLRDSTSFKKYVFDFGNDGVLVHEIREQGLFTAPDGIYYINENGYVRMGTGLIKIDDAYYYVCYSGKLKQSGYQTITEEYANGLNFVGIYYFGEDCKMVVPAEKDHTTGIVWDEANNRYVYKVDGKIQKNAGLIKIDDAYYYVCYSGKLKQSGYQTITEEYANGLNFVGIYYFGEDCKMVVPAEKDHTTGIVWDEANNRYVYKVDGKIQKNAGLIKIEDAYYYVCYSGKLKQSGNQTITEEYANGLLPAGTYYFGEDGKMVTNN